jgi:TfoX/Sxy family transcriptional regulator of competence genes
METKKLIERLTAKYDREPPSLGTQIKKAIEVIKQVRNGKKVHEPSSPH